MKTKNIAAEIDPIRLNIFFDLLLAMSRARDLASLNYSLETHLRLLIEFDECYLIIGNQESPLLHKVYVSTLKAPQLILSNLTNDKVVSCKLGVNPQAKGNKLCMPLVILEKTLGTLILSRACDFNDSEIRFAESISEFLTQVLDNFATQEKLEIANQQLGKQGELRERFVSALSHDLRTPMAAASIAAQLMNRNPTNSELVNAKSLSIVASVNRADQMIRDLLDSNSIHAGGGIPLSIEKCRLDLIVATVVNELNETHGKRMQVHNTFGEIYGHWDPNAIQRMVENLATNAFKYGSPKTPITITLSHGSNWVGIDTHNEGPIITPKDQKILFGQYKRTKSAIVSGQRGWGIGLTLVKGLAEAHHGSVRVESTPGLGTTFYLKLPLDASEFRT